MKFKILSLIADSADWRLRILTAWRQNFGTSRPFFCPCSKTKQSWLDTVWKAIWKCSRWYKVAFFLSLLSVQTQKCFISAHSQDCYRYERCIPTSTRTSVQKGPENCCRRVYSKNNSKWWWESSVSKYRAYFWITFSFSRRSRFSWRCNCLLGHNEKENHRGLQEASAISCQRKKQSSGVCQLTCDACNNSFRLWFICFCTCSNNTELMF